MPWVLKIAPSSNRAEMVVHVPDESLRQGVPAGNRRGTLTISGRAYSAMIPGDAWGRMRFTFEIDRVTGNGLLEIAEKRYGETARYPLRCATVTAATNL
jgi:hypothetical protein